MEINFINNNDDMNSEVRHSFTENELGLKNGEWSKLNASWKNKMLEEWVLKNSHYWYEEVKQND